MLSLLLLVVTLQPPFDQQVQDAYAQEDAEALRQLLAEADTQSDSLLVCYRLYPLSENADLLDDFPASLENGSARDWALLSGLWSYRAGEASMVMAIRYGRRSANLLERAQSLDPTDPYVRLIGAQSYLFRPDIAGKDVPKAIRLLSKLAEQVERDSSAGIPPMEARVWKWLALKEDDRDDQADALYQELRSNDPAPLYRKFLDDPPQV